MYLVNGGQTSFSCIMYANIILFAILYYKTNDINTSYPYLKLLLNSLIRDLHDYTFVRQGGSCHMV